MLHNKPDIFDIWKMRVFNSVHTFLETSMIFHVLEMLSLFQKLFLLKTDKFYTQ